jgi:predicted amidophosphoribosyltransferase
VDRPAWDTGRAAVIYAGGGRRVVLGLKHGDRLDRAKPLAEWMARSGGVLLERADVIVPVPLHWRRLFKRRFNQSAELAQHLSALSNIPYIPDLLVRDKSTLRKMV